jgi:protein-S-isoprenylcysteine O-methyltransferase Ste14
MNERSERPNHFPWPPVILVSGIVAGFVLQAYLPLPWATGTTRDILQGGGYLAIGVAAIIYFLAIRELWNHNTTVNPTGKSSHLVTTGPFAVSRNPIYLANIILTCGIGLAASVPWHFLIAIATGLLEQQFAILREEKHLEHQFGKAWRDYAKRVRRWI